LQHQLTSATRVLPSEVFSPTVFSTLDTSQTTDFNDSRMCLLFYCRNCTKCTLLLSLLQEK